MGITFQGFIVLCWCRRVTIIPICGVFLELLDDVYLWLQSLYDFCTVKEQPRKYGWRPRPLFTVALYLGDTQAWYADRRHAGIKLHLKFSDPSKEWVPLLDRFTYMFQKWSSPFGNVWANCKNRSEGASEKLQIKCWGGLWVQRAVDVLAPAFWAHKDCAVGSVKRERLLSN